MTDTFLRFLAEKKRKLLKQKQRIDDELATLEQSEKLYRASGAYPNVGEKTQNIDMESIMSRHILDSTRRAPYDTHASRTIKDGVRAVLTNNEDGLSSAQVLEKLRETGWPSLERPSLSPQLSRLKSAGEIEIKDGRWVLTARNTGAEDS